MSTRCYVLASGDARVPEFDGADKSGEDLSTLLLVIALDFALRS